MRQTPLMDTSGSSLPSPMFQPRPGWGGKLRAWLGDNSYLLIVRGVVFGAFLLIGLSIANHLPVPGVPQSTASPAPVADKDHHIVVQHGDGLAAIAARAIDESLATYSDLGPLAPVERLWAVTELWHSLPAMHLTVGQTVDFDHLVVASIIVRAKNISPTTRHSLEPYLK